MGQTIAAGELGRVLNVNTGEVLETFRIERPGLLMMAVTTPAMVRPGDFAYMVGHQTDEVTVARRHVGADADVAARR